CTLEPDVGRDQRTYNRHPCYSLAVGSSSRALSSELHSRLCAPTHLVTPVACSATAVSDSCCLNPDCVQGGSALARCDPARSPDAFCCRHGLPRGTIQQPAVGAAPHRILSVGFGWRSARRNLQCPHCPPGFQLIGGVSTGTCAGCGTASTH